MPYMVQNKKIMEQVMDTDLLGIQIVEKLKTIYDPEIPVDIYELGLIYDVLVSSDYEVKILMTLTSPNCPVAESLPREVEEKVKSIEHIKGAEVEITFDPPWSKDLMSEEAKLELGML
jgi:FeS assembly SUF system protein